MTLGELPAYQDPNRIGPAVANVSLDRIRAHPLNVRKELGDLRDLTESIAIEGVLVPLMVERHGEYLRLLHGHRRHAAATLAGLQRVPCVIVDEKSDQDAIVIMLAENIGRRTLTKAEQRDAARKLHESFGMSGGQIAKRVGVAQPTVARWLREDIADGVVKASTRRNAPKPAPKVIYQLVQDWRGRAPDELLDALAELLGDWTPPVADPDVVDLDRAESDPPCTEATQDVSEPTTDIGLTVVEAIRDTRNADPVTEPDLEVVRRRALNLLERGRSVGAVAELCCVDAAQIEAWADEDDATQPAPGFGTTDTGIGVVGR